MKRLIPIVAGLLLLFSLLIAPLLLFRPEKYRKAITDQLAAIFHHPVLIGTLDAHYFPPHLSLGSVSVLKGGDARYLTLDETQVYLGWGALFGQRASPSHIDLAGAHFVVRRLPNGAWDYTDWLGGTGSGTGKDDRPEITLKRSDIRWVDDFGPAHAEIQLANMSGQWTPGNHTLTLAGDLNGAGVPVAVTVAAKGSVGTGDWSGDLKGSDSGRSVTFHLLRQAGLWQVSGESTEWRLDQAVALARFYLRLRTGHEPETGSSFLKVWKTQYSVLGSSQTLMWQAAIDGGSTEMKGTIAEGPTTRLALTAALQNVPLASLKPILGDLGQGAEGLLTGVVTHFDLPLTSAAWEGAHGDFTLELTQGSYRFPQTTLQALNKVKTAHYLRKKYPEFDDKGFPFSRLRMEGVIEKGGFTLSQAGLVSGDVRAAATGRVEVEKRSLDLWLQLQIHEMLPHLRHELPERYVFGEPGQEKIQPIFGHLQGLWSEWKVRAAPRSKVPSAMQKKLRKALSL